MTSPTGPNNLGQFDQLRRANGGFSLIELILVLLVLSLAAAVAVPSMAHFARGRQTSDAATHLLAVIQYAQDRALGTGAPHRLMLDMTSRTYWLTARQDGAFVRLGDEFGQTFTLPTTVASWESSAVGSGQDYIQFEADGGHDVAVVRLVDQDGSALLVGSWAPSEPFRIAQQGTNGQVVP